MPNVNEKRFESCRTSQHFTKHHGSPKNELNQIPKPLSTNFLTGFSQGKPNPDNTMQKLKVLGPYNYSENILKLGFPQRIRQNKCSQFLNSIMEV